MPFFVKGGEKGNFVFPLAWLIEICASLSMIENFFFQINSLLMLMSSEVLDFLSDLGKIFVTLSSYISSKILGHFKFAEVETDL